jgi:hypothetical protein
MWGELDGVRMESAGNPKRLCTAPEEWEITNPYATAWAYLPGPIIEDGTAVAAPPEPADTLFADVSEWQVPVDDSYPYRVISIRSNDGTHRDLDWATNYAWCRRAADDGRLALFLVYFVWRPGVDNVAVLKSMVGDPHPKMAVEIDVESWGGQITGNQSAGLNAAHDELVAWLGDPRRVTAYGNSGDLNNLWPSKPPGMSIRLAAYGSNPAYPGKLSHQFTNGQGYGGGLPEGAPPFGNCDMNFADGYTATAFAAACGIATTPAPPPPPAGGGGVNMADAQGIINQAAGIDGNGASLPWRKVGVRHERAIGDVVNDPDRGEWNSTHNGANYAGTFDADEQMVGVAEQIAWVHTFSDGVKRDDGGDVLAKPRIQGPAALVARAVERRLPAFDESSQRVEKRCGVVHFKVRRPARRCAPRPCRRS